MITTSWFWLSGLAAWHEHSGLSHVNEEHIRGKELLQSGRVSSEWWGLARGHHCPASQAWLVKTGRSVIENINKTELRTRAWPPLSSLSAASAHLSPVSPSLAPEMLRSATITPPVPIHQYSLLTLTINPPLLISRKLKIGTYCNAIDDRFKKWKRF